MKKYSKRVRELKNLITKESYPIQEGMALLKKLGTAKFVESAEAHISLNIDPKYANQQLRTSLVLPNGTGKEVKIAVFTEPDYVEEALKLGASVAGSDDLLDDMTAGNLDFDLLITTPQLMPKLAKLGRVLGPKGLMPSPKSGTVSNTLSTTLTDFKKGKFEYKADKAGIVHVTIGKVNFTEQQLIENLQSFYNSIEKNRPSGVKGKYFKSLSICSTMGPSIKLDSNSFI
jgi:large subunit ribosomal protein L1